MAAGCVIVKSRAARTPAVPAQQVGGHAALVQKDVLTRIVQRQPLSPLPPARRDVSPPLFVGVYGFF